MSTTTNATKTVQTPLLAWQDVNTGNQAISAAVNCATMLAASFGIKIGRRSGSAFTAGWPNIRIEASTKTSGGDSWIPVFNYRPALGSNLANTSTSNTLTNNSTVNCPSANTTNVSVGDIVFLGESNTQRYELGRVLQVFANSAILLEEAVANDHGNGSLITNKAEMAFPSIDLSAYKRIRAVADNANSGRDIAVEVTLTTLDSLLNS